MITHSISKADRPPLALIAGPTASGKSGAAMGIAQAVEALGASAVIINADSAQVYADLRVLSARPSEADEAQVAHRLYGDWDGANPCSVADWAEIAKAVIREAHTQDRLPIIVGGTGLYIRTLLDGIAPIPTIEPAIRGNVRSLTVNAAYAALKSEDPVAHAALNAGDTQRVARALEVVRSTGKPLHQWQQQREGGIGDAVAVAPVVILPNRDDLNARCDARFVQMMRAGAVAEVEALLARNLSPDLPVMRAIGVREIAAMLAGDMTEAEAIASAQQATRQYAKRQYTWLRHQPPKQWPRVGDATEAVTVLQRHLDTP